MISDSYSIAVNSKHVDTMNDVSHAFRALSRISIFGLVAFLSFAANALSCYPINDKFFIDCTTQKCEAVFRAREIHSFGPCARRMLVEEVPPDTESVILSRVGELKRPGMYEVTVAHRFYGQAPVDANQLSEAFHADAFRMPRLTVQSLDVATHLDVLHEQLDRQSGEEFWKNIGYWVVELLLLCVGIVITYGTTSSFRKRLRNPVHGRKIVPVLLQVLAFAISMLTFGSPTSPILVGLVAPVLLVILLYEGACYLHQRFFKKAQA